MVDTEFLIGLDFLGAGNLGDDVMVSGFLEGIKYLGLGKKLRWLRAICSGDRISQALRFPQIEWIDGRNLIERKAAIQSAAVVLGLGGTPFQMSVGDWLLKNLEEIISSKKECVPFILVNAGSESEAGCEKIRIRQVMAGIKSISARDTDTLSILSEWRTNNTRPQLIQGADLANISLPRMCEDHQPLGNRPYELGMILGCDTLGSADVEAVIKWIACDQRPVAWITCEVRNMAGCEYRIYRRNKHRFGGLLSWLWKPHVHLHRPKYHTCDLNALVAPFGLCKTVLSSRYHGLLSAAWSGCRVGGIARTSKIKWLCKQLNIPMIEPPITREALLTLERNSDIVKRSALNDLREAAIGGIASLSLGEY